MFSWEELLIEVKILFGAIFTLCILEGAFLFLMGIEEGIYCFIAGCAGDGIAAIIYAFERRRYKKWKR